MVCYGKRGLLELLGAGNQVVYSIGAVKERVFGMAMEMNEGHHS